MASLLDRSFAPSSTPSGMRTQRIRGRSREAVEERGDEDDEPGQRRQNDKADNHGALLAPSARGLGRPRPAAMLQPQVGGEERATPRAPPRSRGAASVVPPPRRQARRKRRRKRGRRRQAPARWPEPSLRPGDPKPPSLRRSSREPPRPGSGSPGRGG